MGRGRSRQPVRGAASSDRRTTLPMPWQTGADQTVAVRRAPYTSIKGSPAYLLASAAEIVRHAALDTLSGRFSRNISKTA